MKPRFRFEKGFTLLELMVVIAIIAILAAMLLPALNRAKASAQRTTCSNNSRQISVFIRMYSDDSNDAAPKAQWTTNSSSRYLDGSTAFKRLLGNPGRANLFRCP